MNTINNRRLDEKNKDYMREFGIEETYNQSFYLPTAVLFNKRDEAGVKSEKGDAEKFDRDIERQARVFGLNKVLAERGF